MGNRIGVASGRDFVRGARVPFPGCALRSPLLAFRRSSPHPGRGDVATFGHQDAIAALSDAIGSLIRAFTCQVLPFGSRKPAIAPREVAITAPEIPIAVWEVAVAVLE
jgi:hypothetical protein